MTPSKPVLTRIFQLLRHFTGATLFGFCFMGLQACQDEKPPADDLGLGSAAARLGEVAIANVDGTTLYASDVQRRAVEDGITQADTPPDMQDPRFRATLDDLIDQRLLAMEALKQSLDQEDQTRRQLEIARERILSARAVERYLSEHVTEEHLQKLYESQSPLRNAGKEVRARQIVTEDFETMSAALQRLDEGESFSDVAKDLSIDKATQNKGGDLGYFAKGVQPSAIEKVAFALSKGERSEPFETDAGWHVVKNIASRVTPQPSYEDLRGDLLSFLTYEEMHAFITELRTSAQVSLLYESAAQAQATEDINAAASDNEEISNE